jgi:branched-chain amino acid transport system permease protein
VSEVLRPLEETMEAYGISEVIIAIGLLLILIFRPQGIFGSQEPGFLMKPAQRALNSKKKSKPSPE